MRTAATSPRRQRLPKFVAILALAFGVLGGLSASAVLAQPGHIVGTVTDADGDAIEGATIVLGGTPHSVTTSRDGTYRIQAAPGDYLVLATASGYASVEKSVNVASAGVSDLDFELGTTLTQFGDEMVVLGSRAQRTAIETPVPVDVLAEVDIDSTGMSETSRIIQFLAPSFNFSTSTISDGTDIVRPSTLRGLGPDQTLVLINGKRRHNSALVHVNGSIGRGTAGVDLNAIPASAIERIEVLRDGAAAQYGSDAIGGVLNIILKSSTDRTRVDVGTGQHYEGDGEVLRASANHGFRIGDGGFINLTAEYRDRGFTNRSGLDTRQIYATLPDGSTDPREATYDRRNHRYGDAESENGYFFLNGEIPVSDDSAFYFFGGISDRDGESGGFNRLPSQTRTNIFIHPDGHLPLINTGIDDMSISAGYRTTIGQNWSMDAGVVTGENEFNFFISNSANTSMWENSPTSVDAGGFTFDQTTLTLDFYGTADWGLANPVNIAAGLEYREDGYKIRAGEPASFINGGEGNQFCRPPWPQPDSRCAGAPAGIQVFPGFQPVNEVDASRDNVAVYGDLEFQLTDDFLLGVAARFEEYSDFGNNLDGKLAGRYAVTDRFAIRGSASTNFRAPSLHQANLASISTQFVLDPVTGGTVGVQVGTFRNPSPITIGFGVPELKEETSTSYSVGFAARPRANLSVTVDAFSIDIDDRIVLTGRFSSSIPQLKPILDGIGVTAGQFFTNALDTETEGLDVVAAWSTNVGSEGLVSVTGAFNWNSTDIVEIKTPPILEGLGGTLFNDQERVYLQEAQPHQHYNIAGRYSQGPFATTLRFNYFGKVASTESTTGDPAFKQVFGGKWITDLDLAYGFDNGITLHVGANNLFDEFPDVWLPVSVRSNVTFIYPRRTAPFGFNGGYYYLNASFEF